MPMVRAQHFVTSVIDTYMYLKETYYFWSVFHDYNLEKAFVHFRILIPPRWMSEIHVSCSCFGWLWSLLQFKKISSRTYLNHFSVPASPTKKVMTNNKEYKYTPCWQKHSVLSQNRLLVPVKVDLCIIHQVWGLIRFGEFWHTSKSY